MDSIDTTNIRDNIWFVCQQNFDLNIDSNGSGISTKLITDSSPAHPPISSSLIENK